MLRVNLSNNRKKDFDENYSCESANAVNMLFDVVLVRPGFDFRRRSLTCLAISDFEDMEAI